ncbi:MAG TPA: hypothetical protein VGO55_14630 [Allosphingosinicella sp.]|jgi:hypothetical protein|nr:hypothetical protein [Allosphingosinicella sp.]
MFETLEARAARAATRRARQRAAALADEMRAALPPDIKVEADRESVRLSGLVLGRRRALDAALRWTIAGAGR